MDFSAQILEGRRAQQQRQQRGLRPRLDLRAVERRLLHLRVLLPLRKACAQLSGAEQSGVPVPWHPQNFLSLLNLYYPARFLPVPLDRPVLLGMGMDFHGPKQESSFSMGSSAE